MSLSLFNEESVTVFSCVSTTKDDLSV